MKMAMIKLNTRIGDLIRRYCLDLEELMKL
jgi:hypothetical protein